MRPGSGAVIVGDVGWRRWDELDIAGRGSNLGWPCYEGPRPQPAFAHFRICKRLYERGARAPLFASPRGSIGSRHRRAYVYADDARGLLLWARLDARNRLLERPRAFARRTSGIIDLGVDRRGDLLYLSNSTGELRRIRFGRP